MAARPFREQLEDGRVFRLDARGRVLHEPAHFVNQQEQPASRPRPSRRRDLRHEFGDGVRIQRARPLDQRLRSGDEGGGGVGLPGTVAGHGPQQLPGEADAATGEDDRCPRLGVRGAAGRLCEQPRRGAVAVLPEEPRDEDAERGLARAVRADDPERALPRVGREPGDEADRGVAHRRRDDVAVEGVGIAGVARQVDRPDVSAADRDARSDGAVGHHQASSPSSCSGSSVLVRSKPPPPSLRSARRREREHNSSILS